MTAPRVDQVRDRIKATAAAQIAVRQAAADASAAIAAERAVREPAPDITPTQASGG